MKKYYYKALEVLVAQGSGGVSATETAAIVEPESILQQYSVHKQFGDRREVPF